MDLQKACDQAYSLELAQRNTSCYSSVTPHLGHSATLVTLDQAYVPRDDAVKDKHMSEGCETTTENQVLAATLSRKKRCFFWRFFYHNRTTFPARTSTCDKCDKKGHFPHVCLSKISALAGKTSAATMFNPSQASVLASVAGTTFPQSLRQEETSLTINRRKFTALLDSCSYIDENVARELKLRLQRTDKSVTLA